MNFIGQGFQKLEHEHTRLSKVRARTHTNRRDWTHYQLHSRVVKTQISLFMGRQNGSNNDIWLTCSDKYRHSGTVEYFVHAEISVNEHYLMYDAISSVEHGWISAYLYRLCRCLLTSSIQSTYSHCRQYKHNVYCRIVYYRPNSPVH